MIIKELLRKQIIVPINETNTEFIINLAHSHIVADFICKVNNGIIITTNQIVANLNIKVIKKYLKNNNEINSDPIKSSCLLLSKLYIKITRLPYTLEHTNSSIIPNILESVIKEIYLFNETHIKTLNYQSFFQI